MKKLILHVNGSPVATHWPTYEGLDFPGDVYQVRPHVIATPIAIFETGEHTALKDIAPPVDVLGLSTEFQVHLVLKGGKGMNKFVLHHYKLEHEEPMISGPELISFDPKLWGAAILAIFDQRTR